MQRWPQRCPPSLPALRGWRRVDPGMVFWVGLCFYYHQGAAICWQLCLFFFSDLFTEMHFNSLPGVPREEKAARRSSGWRQGSLTKTWGKGQPWRWRVHGAGSGGCGVSPVSESAESRCCKKSKHPTALCKQAQSLREM